MKQETAALGILSKVLLLLVCLASSLNAQLPDIGEVSALKDLRRVWFSVQALSFKSNLSGSQLREMTPPEKDNLKSDLDNLIRDRLRSRLSAAGLEAIGLQVMVEDAWSYLDEVREKDPDQRITRELLVSMAHKQNRTSPNGIDPHLRLCIVIQQDGNRHVGRLELSLIEKVYLRRRPGAEFSTVVWSVAEEAVPLGAYLNRQDLEDAADRLFKAFESNLEEVR